MLSGSLVGLSDKQVQVRGHMTLATTYGEGEDAKEVNVGYLIVDSLSPYNVILGRTNINALRAIISTQYLVLKYPFPGGKVGKIQGDQQIGSPC